MRMILLYIIKNPEIIASIISTVGLVIATVYVSKQFILQKDIEAQFRGKGYLIEKRMGAYEEVVESVSKCLNRRMINKEDYIVLIDIYKKYEDIKIENLINNNGEYLDNCEKVYSRYLDNQDGLFIILESKSHLESYEELQGLLISKGLYMSNEVQRSLRKLTYLLSSSNLEIHKINIALKHVNGKKKDYKKYLRPKFAFIMRESLTYYINEIREQIMLELNTLDFKIGGPINYNTIHMVQELIVEIDQEVEYTPYVKLLKNYCGETLVSNREKIKEYNTIVHDTEIANEAIKTVQSKMGRV